MHPDILIVCTYRRSDGLSTIPDDQNTFTRQSANTNNAPRDPLHGPVTNLISCGYNASSMQVLLQLRMMERAARHAYYPFMYNGYFPIQTEFSLIGNNYVTNNVTHISLMYHYIPLVIYLSKLPLKVQKNSYQRQSFNHDQRAQSHFCLQKT